MSGYGHFKAVEMNQKKLCWKCKGEGVVHKNGDPHDWYLCPTCKGKGETALKTGENNPEDENKILRKKLKYIEQHLQNMIKEGANLGFSTTSSAYQYTYEKFFRESK